MNPDDPRFRIVAVGCSAGGLEALSSVLSRVTFGGGACMVIVQHMGPSAENFLVEVLDRQTGIPVHEATDKMPMEAGRVYVAPPNYHLLVEKDGSFSLSLEGRVNFSRPSIDVLFESVARAFTDRVTGIILTGANRDGQDGCRQIRLRGGRVLVQDPGTAEHRSMPDAAIDAGADAVMRLDELAVEISRLFHMGPAGSAHD